MNENLESRVAALERVLRAGLYASTNQGDEEIRRLRMAVSQLQSSRSVGNVLGGNIRTEIAPFPDTWGPYKEAIDPTFPVEFTLWVPDYLLRIKRYQLRLEPMPIRSSVVVATTEAPADSSGASTEETTVASESVVELEFQTERHYHIWGKYETDGDNSYTKRIFNTPPSNSTPIADPESFTDAFNIETEFGRDLITGLQVPNSVASTIVEASHPTHVHGMDHTHTIPAHAHELELGIAESGMASGLTIIIDGIDRTVALGGPWDGAVVIDIADYLINARQEPILGAHSIEIGSVTVGAVEVWADIYGVVKALQ